MDEVWEMENWFWLFGLQLNLAAKFKAMLLFHLAQEHLNEAWFAHLLGSKGNRLGYVVIFNPVKDAKDHTKIFKSVRSHLFNIITVLACESCDPWSHWEFLEVSSLMTNSTQCCFVFDRIYGAASFTHIVLMTIDDLLFKFCLGFVSFTAF